jgi:hypothetical protein
VNVSFSVHFSLKVRSKGKVPIFFLYTFPMNQRVNSSSVGKFPYPVSFRHISSKSKEALGWRTTMIIVADVVLAHSKPRVSL